jgi:plasmid stability protein
MASTEAVKIRKLPDWVLDAHRARAAQEGVSLEEELRVVLTEAALKPKLEFAGKAAELTASLRAKYGTFSDSTDLIREEREERG